MTDDKLRWVLAQLSKQPAWAIKLARPNFSLVQFLLRTYGTPTLHVDTLVRKDFEDQRLAKYGSASAAKTKSVHNPLYQRKVRAYTRLLQELQVRGFVVYDRANNVYKKTEDAARLWTAVKRLTAETTLVTAEA